MPRQAWPWNGFGEQVLGLRLAFNAKRSPLVTLTRCLMLRNARSWSVCAVRTPNYIWADSEFLENSAPFSSPSTTGRGLPGGRDGEGYPIKRMCELLEVSRSGFYKWRRALQPEATRASSGAPKLDAKVAASHCLPRCVHTANGRFCRP